MNAQREYAIEIEQLHTYFGETCVHENVNLKIAQGEITAIVGSSGSGKTTLLREMIMLLSPTRGSIRINGEEIVNAGAKLAAQTRRRFGVMFQQGALFSSLTVLDNIAVPLREHTDLPDAAIEHISMLKLLFTGLPPEAASRFPQQLSGGMIKRASVSRALALDPDILFLDEPSSGLDPVGAAALDDLILKLRDSLGLTVVLITHDLDTMWRITDSVAFLGGRRVIAHGPVKEVADVEDPLIQDFFHGFRGRSAQEHAWTQR